MSVLGVSMEDQRLLCVNSEDVVAPRGDPAAKAPPHKESFGSAGKLRLVTACQNDELPVADTFAKWAT